MLVDPFTVLAQIVNFLILVALLKHFLYSPITRAMAQRQQTIAQQLEQAAKQEQQAQQETERLRQMQQDFAAHREERLVQLRSQLEDERLTRLEQAEDEVEAARDRWFRGLAQEQTTVLRSFRQHAAYQLSQTVRQVLVDLANADLERQILTTFLSRLQHLPNAEREILQTALLQGAETPITLRSSFPLQESDRTVLISSLQALRLDPQQARAELVFERNPALGCGIELVAPGYKLAWNFETYLNTLERNLAHEIDQHIESEPMAISA